jgi:hypothetical protein
MMAGKLAGQHRDRNVGFALLGVVLVAIVVISILAPASADSNPIPSTYNSGSGGAKAAYLLASELGYETARWDSPTANLSGLDAAHTTLIFADPNYPAETAKQVQGDIAGFLARGGRVIATGAAGAYLLPGGHTANPSSSPTQKLELSCRTTPVASSMPDPLAQAGTLFLPSGVRWDTPATIRDSPTHSFPVHVSQRCGDDAVVISYPYYKGEAIWWGSAKPLSNAGLKEDADLKLVLASLGLNAVVGADSPTATRRILFDEYFHGDRGSLWETAAGLPIYPLLAQVGLVAVLLVLSFGRRSGPLRAPVQIPRTSPVEFAESMGRLYRSGNATYAAIDAARRRLLLFLTERCGVPREIVRGGSAATVVEALQQRFPGDWSRVATHLTQAAQAEYTALAPKAALTLVRALDRDQLDLATAARAAQPLEPARRTTAA